jgi:hypothetical protein
VYEPADGVVTSHRKAGCQFILSYIFKYLPTRHARPGAVSWSAFQPLRRRVICRCPTHLALRRRPSPVHIQFRTTLRILNHLGLSCLLPCGHAVRAKPALRPGFEAFDRPAFFGPGAFGTASLGHSEPLAWEARHGFVHAISSILCLHLRYWVVGTMPLHMLLEYFELNRYLAQAVICLIPACQSFGA